MDSVVLLHALNRLVAVQISLCLDLSAVHHGISPNADAWAEFLQLNTASVRRCRAA
ncbi:MAG: hypothetical protein IPL29_03875 [Propionivibrio sp.]|nr:hypothetical protein [Propionivibrio sp.]